MARLTFWFEFASTYSYLSAMRIEEMARKADVEVIWKPFLLGPIFKAQNWDTSPFNVYPAKGRYMVRDIERIAEARGLAFRLPDPFPQNGLARGAPCACWSGRRLGTRVHPIRLHAGVRGAAGYLCAIDSHESARGCQGSRR